MMRKLSLIIILTLFLSSCGIPVIYNFDNLIEIKYNSTDTNNTKIDITYDTSENKKVDALKNIKSTSIIYLYTIEDDGKSNSSIISKFKTLYIGDD